MDHAPDRPQWTCRDCQEEWPCEARRKELIADLVTPAQIRVTLSVYWPLAVVDLRELPPRTIWKRFYGWIPHAPRPRLRCRLAAPGWPRRGF